MPKLPTYSAQLVNAPSISGRRADATDFGGGVGAALQGAGEEARKVGQTILEEEVRKDKQDVILRQATLRREAADALAEADLTGGDLEKVRKDYNDKFAAVANSAKTTDGLYLAKLMGEEGASAFNERVRSVDMKRAGEQAKLTVQQTVNELGKTMQSTPGYLPEANRMVEAAIDNWQDRLPPTQIAALKQAARNHLATLDVSNQIIDSPKETYERLKKGDFEDLTPEQRVQLTNRAYKQWRDDLAQEAADIRNRKTIAQNNATDAVDEYTKTIISGGTIDLKKLAVDQRFESLPEIREHIANFSRLWAEHASGATRKSNPEVLSRLQAGYLAPDGDPSKLYGTLPIWNAVKRGEINATDARSLVSFALSAKDAAGNTALNRFRAGVKRFEAMFPPLMWIGREDERARTISQWTTRVSERMEQLQNEGKSPNVLFDEKSDEYVFAPAFVAEVKEAARAEGKRTVWGDTLNKVQPGQEWSGPDGVIRRWNGKPKYITNAKGEQSFNHEAWEFVSGPGPDRKLIPEFKDSDGKVHKNVELVYDVRRGTWTEPQAWVPTRPLKISPKQIEKSEPMFFTPGTAP